MAIKFLNTVQVDTDVLYVDTANDRVGVGTDSPDSKLHIDSTGEALRFTRSSQETYRVIHGTSGLYFTGPNTASLVLGITQNSDVDIFNTSGSVMFRADGSSGNVGIGTTSPFTNLEIEGSGLDSIIRLYTATGAANIRTWEMRAVGVAGEGLLFRQVNDANTVYTNRMILDNSGNVGIGTISPDSKLNIEGPKNTAILTLGNTTAGSSWVVGDRVGGIDFYSGDGSGGGIGVKASISYEEAVGGTGSSQAMVFRTGGNTSGTNNVERMRLQYNGNVGIGTDSPGFKLDVAGTGNFTGLVSGITPVAAANFVTKAYADGLTPGAGVFLPLAGGTMTGNLDMSDNTLMRFGAGNDLIISHQAGPITYGNFITSTDTVRDLIFKSNVGFQFKNTNLIGSETLAVFNTNGSINLYYDNTKKFETTPAGATVTGSLGVGTTTPSYKLHVKGGNDAGIIAERDTSGTEGQIFMLAGDTTNVIASKGSGNNAKQLNFNIGIAPKVSIDTSGRVGVGTQTPTTTLDVRGNLRADLVQLFSGSTQYLNMSSYSGTPWINTGSSGGVINFGAPSSNTTNVYVQGTVEARDGLLGFVPTFVHGGFYHSSSSSSSAIYWIPSNYISETTSTQYYNRFVAPYPGRVKKVIMRWTNGATPTATSVTFRKTQNGGVSSTQYAATVTGGATTSMVATKEFSNTDFTFNAGDKYGIGFMTNGGTRLLYGMTYTLVIEYNI